MKKKLWIMKNELWNKKSREKYKHRDNELCRKSMHGTLIIRSEAYIVFNAWKIYTFFKPMFVCVFTTYIHKSINEMNGNSPRRIDDFFFRVQSSLFFKFSHIILIFFRFAFIFPFHKAHILHTAYPYTYTHILVLTLYFFLFFLKFFLSQLISHPYTLTIFPLLCIFIL